MIWIWKGRGWMVGIFTLIGIGASIPCANVLVRMVYYSNETAISIGVALIYAGVFMRTFFLLFPAKKPLHLFNVETGEDIFLPNVDSLYYLDVKYWGYGFIGVGILVLSVGLFTALN